MKKRMSRNNESRKHFKIDTLLERRAKEESDMCVTNLGSYMTLTFLGYYDEQVDRGDCAKAKLELVLIKQENPIPVRMIRLIGYSKARLLIAVFAFGKLCV